jgi:hypothetical protein
MSTLAQLADAVPVLNQRAAKQAQANRAVALQSQVGQAQVQPGVSATRAAQVTAPQAVGQQAQVQTAGNEQTQQQLGQVANVALQTKATATESNLAAQEQDQRERLAAQENTQKLQLARADIAMRKKVTGKEMETARRLQTMGIELDNKLQIATIRQREQLNRLGGDVKDKILDSRLKFERDDMGRKFTNERQLADYNLANAKTEQEFNEKMREIQQQQERKLQLLEVVEKKMRQELEQSWQFSEQTLDNQSKARMVQALADMKERIRKEQAKARNNAAMWQAGGTIAGAVVGGAVGSAAGGVGAVPGAMIGASVGGAVGTVAGGYYGGGGY